MKKFLSLTLLLCLFCLTTRAHIGSNGVLMQQQAGPYKVLISITPPDVIPGTAQVSVFVETGTAEKVLARPIYFRLGDQGAPSYDELPGAADQKAQFTGQVWLMERGSSSIQIQVNGKEGKAELIVPVVAVSTAQTPMPSGLGLGLAILGIFLFVLMVTTIGASVSDGILRAGENLTETQKRKKFVHMGVAAVICGVILFAGSSWWNAWAANYKQHLYKPLTIQSKVQSEAGERVFQLKIDTTNWQENKRGSMLSTITPDHGKLMHVFLVRTPGLDAFAHMHPDRIDSTTFRSALPDLPPGKYLVYADVLQYSGFAETMVDTLVIQAAASKTTAQSKTATDDGYVITDAINAPGKIPVAENVVICGRPGSKTIFKDSSYAVWDGQPGRALETGKPYSLNFEIFNPDGTPTYPEPYLGMMGHAVVLREDGSVYIHLHPSGTFAMTAEQILKTRLSDTTKIVRRPPAQAYRDSVDRYLTKLKAMSTDEREQVLMTEMGMYAQNASNPMGGMDHSNRISFPYVFPKKGRYRIFIQVKRNGQVLTGAFDVQVKETAELVSR